MADRQNEMFTPPQPMSRMRTERLLVRKVREQLHRQQTRLGLSDSEMVRWRAQCLVKNKATRRELILAAQDFPDIGRSLLHYFEVNPDDTSTTRLELPDGHQPVEILNDRQAE